MRRKETEMTDPKQDGAVDNAMHPDSLVANQIKADVVRVIRLMINNRLDTAAFISYAIDAEFRITVERMPS